MCLVDGCVRWACQVGVSGRSVRWACQVGVAHLPAHPPVIPISPMTNVCGGCDRLVCKVGRSGGCGRWEWQVGVTGGRGSAYEDSHIQSPLIQY